MHLYFRAFVVLKKSCDGHVTTLFAIIYNIIKNHRFKIDGFNAKRSMFAPIH